MCIKAPICRLYHDTKMIKHLTQSCCLFVTLCAVRFNIVSQKTKESFGITRTVRRKLVRARAALVLLMRTQAFATDTFFECHTFAGVPMASLAKQSRPCRQERNRRYPEEMVSSRISTYSDKENCTQNASTIGYASTIGSKMAGRHLTREYSVLNIDRESGHSTKTIALFGAETKTGNEFLRMALDAGYAVRAMSLPHVPSQSDYAGLEWIRANSLYDKEAVELVIQDADFVVCMVNAESATEIDDEERCPKPKSATAVDASKPVTSFIDILYPLMKMEKSVQVFLFQVRHAIHMLYPFS